MDEASNLEIFYNLSIISIQFYNRLQAICQLLRVYLKPVQIRVSVRHNPQHAIHDLAGLKLFLYFKINKTYRFVSFETCGADDSYVHYRDYDLKKEVHF